MLFEVLVLVMLVYLLFYFMSMSIDGYSNMVSPYECGFDPSMSSRVGFSYRFFLISILFLIFDVEVTLLLPLPYEGEGWEVMVGVLYFMTVLLGGLLYEYFNGVLSWLK